MTLIDVENVTSWINNLKNLSVLKADICTSTEVETYRQDIINSIGN